MIGSPGNQTGEGQKAESTPLQDHTPSGQQARCSPLPPGPGAACQTPAALHWHRGFVGLPRLGSRFLPEDSQRSAHSPALWQEASPVSHLLGLLLGEMVTSLLMTLGDCCSGGVRQGLSSTSG